MTPEQKQIAIAEFEGWKVHPKDRFIVIPPNSPHSVQPLHTLPPYLTSRDAICGAVARLDDVGRMKFVWHLSDTVSGYEPEPVEEKDMPALEGSRFPLDYIASLLLATPAQLADALLLTLGHKL